MGTRCFGQALKAFKDRPPDYDRRKPMKISDFLGDFLSNASADYSPKTLQMYSQYLKELIQVIGNKPMRFVSVRDVERFKNERAKKISPVSVNVGFRTLRAAFNVAVRWRVIDQNPFLESRLLRVPEKEPAYLSKADFNLLVSVVEDEKLRNLIVLAVYTMMRRGEIINLEWSDIDLQRHTLHVRSKEGFTVKGRRKRVIPMVDESYSLLARIRPTGRFVFSDENGEKLKEGFVTRRFKAYVRKAGLPESLHFHSLRHTGASWLVQKGVQLYAVQRMLGHSSPAMTQIYSHHSELSLMKAIEQVAFIPSPSQLN